MYIRQAVLILTALLAVPVASQELRDPVTDKDWIEALTGQPAEHQAGQMHSRGMGLGYTPCCTRHLYIPFPLNSANIPNDPSVKRKLNSLASALYGALPNMAVLVAGYTDNRGRAQDNKRLSRRRAQAVAYYLSHRVEHRVSKQRLQIAARGATSAFGTDRALNRRVEIIPVK